MKRTLERTIERGRIPLNAKSLEDMRRDANWDDSPDGARPVFLTWTDPEDGDELWIEMWGSHDFVDELLQQGFQVRVVEEDETASSLCVRIVHS